MQVAGLFASLGVTAALIAGLRRRGMDDRWAAIWAWSPFAAIEAVGWHVEQVARHGGRLNGRAAEVEADREVV